MCLSRVPEFFDERMGFEHPMNGCTLYAYSTSVNEPHFVQPCLEGCVHILLDDRWDVSRRERVQVERPFDGNVVRHF